MEAKLSVDEIEPFCVWQKDEHQDVLELHLQGFKKEQVRVRINRQGVLTISGERPLDKNKRVRFCKEIKVSKEDCETGEIHAKFSGGILYITMPKRTPLLLPAQTQESNGNYSNQNNNNNNTDQQVAAAGTSCALGTMCKPIRMSISGLLLQRRQMDAKTALKFGAVAAAVMVVAAVVAFVAYTYRRGYHVVEH